MGKLIQITSPIGIFMLLFISVIHNGVVREEWMLLPLSYLFIYISIVMHNEINDYLEAK